MADISVAEERRSTCWGKREINSCINTITRSKVCVFLVIVVLLCGFAVYRSLSYLKRQSITFQTSGLTYKPPNKDVEISSKYSKGIIKLSLDNAEETLNLTLGNTNKETKLVPGIMRETAQQPKNTRKKMIKPSVQNEKDSKFEEVALKQNDRIHHFRQNCRRLGCDKKIFKGKLNLFYSNKHKLAWKMVPKIGSTFLIQAFEILNDEATEKVFEKSRSHIHIGGDKFSYKKELDLHKLQNFTVLVMTRNPFSRLFSAYIDKVYLPNALHLPRQVYLKNVAKTGERDCKFKNTFDEFLNYALDDTVERLDRGHYGPVVSKTACNKICQIPNIVLVKQESFSEDIEYALRLVGVEGKKYSTIHAAMHEKNVQSTIPGIVKTIYEKMKQQYERVNFNKIVSEHCLSWVDVAERLWKSFQIQGYIHDKIGFPHNRFKDKSLSNAKYLIDVMLEEVEKHPLTHEQKVKQRTKAMLNAYSGVSEETISKIEEQYSLDFSLYDYSHNLLDV